MKYYFDSDVWIAFMNEKDERHGLVVQLFEKIIKERSVILISQVHFKEMFYTDYLKQFKKIRNKLWKDKICRQVPITECNRQVALKHHEYLKLGFSDCLHLIMAKENKAKACSFDKHWQQISQKLGMRIYEAEEILRS